MPDAYQAGHINLGSRGQGGGYEAHRKRVDGEYQYAAQYQDNGAQWHSSSTRYDNYGDSQVPPESVFVNSVANAPTFVPKAHQLQDEYQASQPHLSNISAQTSPF